MLGVQNPNLASSVIFDSECMSWAKWMRLRITSIWRWPLIFLLFLSQDLVLIPSDFKCEFCPCYLSCALSLTGKPRLCGSYSGCKGINVWDGSFHRHWTIWSFSATGSYDLAFRLCTNKECFVCTAESKTTCRQFPWYSGFAEAWQEKTACVYMCYTRCVAPTSLYPGLYPTTIY